MALRTLRILAVAGVVLFWAGVFIAGSLIDGYSARADYISSLASRGSPVAVLGVATLLASAGAHLVTSWAALRAWRSLIVAAFLFFAGMASGLVALFRASCPSGPPGCALTETSGGDWVDAVHGASVGVYELLVLATMLTLALGALRRSSKWPRWLGLVSLLFAIGSVLLVGQTNGDDIGLWQRLWLADNLAWLLIVAWVATSPTSPRLD